MRVAIFGSYNHGNYGDDLMAILYARIIKDMGHEVIIYRFAEDLGKSYGFLTTNSIDELIKDATFCIIGGGAFLASTHLPMSDVFFDLEEQCLALKNTCEKYNCPIYGISIGGEGYGERTALGLGRTQLYSSAIFKGASVRIEGDMKLLQFLQKEAIYFPDVLWQTSNYWNAEKKTDDNKFNIGINLSDDQLTKKIVEKLMLVKNIANINLTFFRLHRPQYNLNYEYFHHSDSANIKNITYTTPEEFIPFLANQDLVISAKLHLGLTGLSYYVPFISLLGQGKTTALLKSIGFNRFILPPSRKKIIKLIYDITFNKSSILLNEKETLIVQQEVKKSEGHLDYLKRLVNHYSLSE